MSGRAKSLIWATLLMAGGVTCVLAGVAVVIGMAWWSLVASGVLLALCGLTLLAITLEQAAVEEANGER